MALLYILVRNDDGYPVVVSTSSDEDTITKEHASLGGVLAGYFIRREEKHDA